MKRNARAQKANRRRKQERQITVAQIRSTRQRAKATTPPAMTPTIAREFAKLLASGVPGTDALRYLAPDVYATLDEGAIVQWLDAWANDAHVLRAITKLNGAEWHHLDSDDRFTIAMDKHLCELAYFLYTHRYTTADPDVARKMDKAADRIQAYLSADGEKGTGDDVWKTFAKEIMATVAKDQSSVPSVLPTDNRPPTKFDS